MSFVTLSDVPSFDMAPGATGRALFGEKGMINIVELAPGAEIATHSHPHEQLGMILRGSMRMVVAGEAHDCPENVLYVIPGGLEHGGQAGPEGATVLDVFVPVREDYRDRAGAG